MKKIFFLSLIVSSSIISSEVFSYSCDDLPFYTENDVEGTQYPAVGVPATYYHDSDTLDYRFKGEVATFTSSNGFRGTDEYNYQDFKWRAKKEITFSSLDRGPHWVHIQEDVSEGPFGSHCINVWVQEKPKISKVSLDSSTKQVKVNYTVDTYSKYVREGKPRIITISWIEETYGERGTGATISTTNLSGIATATLSFPRDGLYSLQATIFDGTYSSSVFLGTLDLGPAEPPCPLCQPL